MKKRGLAAALAMLTMATYYNYADDCMLRANSGSLTANYTVWGEWNPNG